MISPQTKKELDNHIFLGANIVELGDQFCDWNAEVQGTRSNVYFKSIGVNVTSIDWHGNNDAVKLDLSTLLNDKFEADILTDFGTLEHVKNTYNALVNCFNFTKVDGIMIHVNPDKTYTKHGFYYFTELFWRKFAEMNGYEIISIYSERPYDITNPALEVYAVLRKTDKSKMCSEKQFGKLKQYLGDNE